MADFFLRKFLGCQLREAPEVTTKRLFQVTEDFIHEEIAEPEVKASYVIALLAELGSQTRIFDPRTFAREHLRVEDRQKYIDYLENAAVPPQPFDKDISLIETHLKRIQLDFQSGIAVLGSPETFKEHVKMTDLDDGRTRLEIEDRVKRLHGRR